MRKLVPLVALAGAGVLLSSCSLAGDQLPRPDAAAVVDGQTVSLSGVDDDADAVCSALEGLAQPGGSIAKVAVEAASVQYAVLREIGDQMAEQYDVDAGAGYDAALGQYEQQFSLEPDAEGVARTLTSPDYFLAIAIAASGGDATDPDLTDEQAQQIADDALTFAQGWVDDHDVTVNPRFDPLNLSSVQALYVPSGEQGELSVAVSDEAKGAVEDRTNLLDLTSSDAAADLPADQRCGG